MPILIPPNTATSFEIETDSSDYANRVVLSQESKTDSKCHLVVFFNKSLSPVKYNYKTHDKKMLVFI